MRQTSRVQSRSQAPQATCNVQVTEDVLNLSLNPAMGEATCLEGSQASGGPHAASVQSRFQVPRTTATVQMVGTCPNPVWGTAFGSVAGEALGTQVVDEVPHPGQDPLHSLVVDEEKGLGMSPSPTMSQAAIATLVGQAPQVEVNCRVAEASSPGCQVECGPAIGQDRSLVIAQVSNLPNSVSNVACGSVVKRHHNAVAAQAPCLPKALQVGSSFQAVQAAIAVQALEENSSPDFERTTEGEQALDAHQDLSMLQVPRFVKFGHSDSSHRLPKLANVPVEWTTILGRHVAQAPDCISVSQVATYGPYVSGARASIPDLLPNLVEKLMDGQMVARDLFMQGVLKAGPLLWYRSCVDPLLSVAVYQVDRLLTTVDVVVATPQVGGVFNMLAFASCWQDDPLSLPVLRGYAVPPTAHGKKVAPCGSTWYSGPACFPPLRCAFGYKGSWPRLTGLFSGALQCQTAMLPDLDTPTLVFVSSHRAFFPGESSSPGESLSPGENLSPGER